MSIKFKIKKIKILYYLLYRFRNFFQTRAILREQLRFELMAESRSVSKYQDVESVFLMLKDRLRRRGISWPPFTNGRPLHILYASLPGNWELHNIPPELEKLGKVTCFFLKDHGISINGNWPAIRHQVDMLLPATIEKVHRESPVDMVLSYLSGSQISPETIEKIGLMGIPTFSFHLDDRRYFYGYQYGDQWSGPAAVCRAYDLNLTNSTASLIKYRCEGANVLFWPEGANPEYFRPLDIPFEYDVTFCGARYGVRPLLVEYLRNQGIKVDCFGKEWEHGYQSGEALVKIFNSSRINLGFGFVLDSNDQCLKGRDFEIPSCAALYLTSHNEDLSKMYQVGVEIETYASFEDCANKIKMLLNNPVRCSRIRAAARKAVLERHTWSLRTKQLLDCVGVPMALH